MTAHELREKYLKFFESRGHKIIPPAPLVLQNDPTTLFTSSGMQPLVPYLMGQKHPEGKRVVDFQPAIRLQDIEEVGDNRHTTFFEMLGNWSFGDYFKKEQLTWILEFLTEELNIPKDKLYMSIFKGDKSVPRDEESYNILLSLGVSKNHIFEYDVKKNWWSRSGTPDEMPAGEPGGPTSEIFYEFDSVKHDKKFGEKCHPNCDCGRFVEIGNSVFMVYKKTEDGLEELPNKNVDFGGGFERILVSIADVPDVFKSDVFDSTIKAIEKISKKSYDNAENQYSMRVVADHMRAAVFLINSGVTPSNKLQGYVLRRLLRRAALKMRSMKGEIRDSNLFESVVSAIVKTYGDIYFGKNSMQLISKVVSEEISRFSKSLELGLKVVGKISDMDGKKAFDLYQSYGFPLELTEELFAEKGQKINKKQFRKEFEKHQEGSRSAAKGMFKGGLADHSTEVTRLHTAHHLLLASLQKTIDPKISQKGSNINAERLRMDFNFDRKLTEDELQSVTEIINKKIKENLKVTKKIMTKTEAEKIGAEMEFGAKYPDRVSIYFIGPEDDYFSAEFCGGPHVENTSEVGRVKIIKQEKVGTGVMRIYATAKTVTY